MQVIDGMRENAVTSSNMSKDLNASVARIHLPVITQLKQQSFHPPPANPGGNQIHRHSCTNLTITNQEDVPPIRVFPRHIPSHANDGALGSAGAIS